MRVSERQIFSQASANAARAREENLRASQEVSSGLRVEHPSDDPAAAAQATQAKLAIARFDAIGTTVKRVADEVQASDGALDTVTTALARARELAVQLSNSTYTAAQRAGAATEVDGLFQQILGALNTKVGARYVFAGHLDAAPPFDATGTYRGDAGVQQVEIAPGVVQAASLRADAAFTTATGGVDVLATVKALSTALSTNNLAGIQGSLTSLDTSVTQVATARSQLGSTMATFDAAGEAARASRDAQTAALGHLQDADAIEASTRLAASERALDAALTAAARSFKMTLLEKL